MNDEERYKYWNEFDTPHSYMIADGENQYAVLRSLIFNFVAKGSSVLDVGCACGDNLEWSEKLGKDIKYKGVDYSEAFIKANKKRRPDIKWEEQDARQLSERANSYDVVILYDVLDALDKWEKAIDEAVRVAKNRVIILMWMDANMQGKKEYLESKELEVLKLEIEGHGQPYHYMLVGKR